MKKALLFVMAGVMLCSTLAVTACRKEVVYVYEPSGGSGGGEVTGGGGGNGNGGNTNPGGNGGNTNPGGNTNTDDGSSYKLTVWCAEEDKEMILDMLDDYKTQHRANTYTFKVEGVGEDVVSSSVTRDKENAGDIFSFANDQLGILRNQDALYQIPDIYKKQITDQIEVAVTACREGGNYYAIPYSYENCFLYYNKSLVNEQDVRSMEGLLSKSISGVEANLAIDMSDSYYTTMFLYTAGMELFGPDGTDATSVNLANAKTTKGCEYIAWLGGQSKLKSILKADQTAALKQKKIASIISGPHMIEQFKDALGNDFGVAMLPTIKLDGRDTQLYSFSGVKMYGIANKSTSVRDAKTTAEACRLAAFLANKDNQQIRLERREFCPTQYELFELANQSDIKTVEVVVSQSEYSKLKPCHAQMSAYWTPMANFLKGVYDLRKAQSVWMGELAKIETQIKES